jgi:hypothetical protein
MRREWRRIHCGHRLWRLNNLADRIRIPTYDAPLARKSADRLEGFCAAIVIGARIDPSRGAREHPLTYRLQPMLRSSQALHLASRRPVSAA